MQAYRWQVYLSGEIHTPWRDELKKLCKDKELPIDWLAPVCNHGRSDACGAEILGAEDEPFWHDHKAARINTIRIRNAIERADVVVVRFGDKYRQWNAAFDAGHAVAMGKSLITLHDPDLNHALKEINAAAMASARTPTQVADILEYVIREI